MSGESGRQEVYVESFPKPGGGKWQISKDGGSHLRWRRDGREIVYYARDGFLMSVPVSAGSSFAAGAPVRLFEARMLAGPLLRLGYQAQFDIAPDGSRFLLNVPVEDPTPSPFNVIVNWKSYIKE
jgi:hypothetical protein